MKRKTNFKHLLLLLLATTMVFGCSKYDDTELKNDVSDIKSRVEKLEAWVKTANSDISALQELVTTLQNNDYVKGVTPVMEDAKEVGYTITFAKSKPVTINHGKDGGGTKGAAPIIGVDKDANGLYYWTIKTGNADADWLLDGDGNKIPTTGDKGRAPVLSIETEASHHYWKVDGQWLLLPDGKKAPATGEQGDSFFENVTPDAEKGHVVFKLKGGKEFMLPMASTTVSFDAYTPLQITELDTETKVIVKLPATLKKTDFAAIKTDITNVAGTSTTITRSPANAEPQKWTVALTAPTFKADGTLDAQPTLKVIVPASAQEGETALLEVTVVDTKGEKSTSTRVLFYTNKVAVTDVKVKNITLTNATLTVGEIKALRPAVITPDNATNKTLKWESNDTNIAIINQATGEVEAKAAGTATITATATDGSNATGTCTVTVNAKKEEPVGGLSIGDFYMKDGTTVSKGIELTPEQKANCIGIVLKVGRDTDGNWKDDCEYKQKDGKTPMKEIKGYVLALNDANNGNGCQWGSRGKEAGTKLASPIGFWGYKDTQTIKKLKDYSENAFPAVFHALNYELSHAAPANSSGWFLPSIGQCRYWLIKHKQSLLISIKKATSNSDYKWKNYYWSSSESIDTPSEKAWYESQNEYDESGYYDKNYAHCIRSFLAF